MAKTQLEDRAVFLLSALLAAALPMARYVQRHGNAEDREKLRRLTGSREYEELSTILVQLRR
jgi:predicted lipid-binding transport protein (Tim44 family)